MIGIGLLESCCAKEMMKKICIMIDGFKMHEVSCIIPYSCLHAFMVGSSQVHTVIWLIGSGNIHARALGDLAVASHFLSIEDSVRG